MIIANLGADAEMRYAPSGDPVVSFRCATNKSWTGNDGQKHESSVWWRVTYWGKTAEKLMPYLLKGKQVMVKGELDTPKPFQLKDGTWAAGLELKASFLKLLGGGSGGSSQSTSFSQPATHETISEDQIPF